MPQFMATAGICAGYFTCYGTIHIESTISWRLPFIVQTVLGVGLALSCMYLPNSPRWLIHQGKQDEAIRAADRLKLSRAEVEKDILSMSREEARHRSPWRGFTAIFRPQYRARTTLGLFILGMVQLCGIDGVLYVRWTS